MTLRGSESKAHLDVPSFRDLLSIHDLGVKSQRALEVVQLDERFEVSLNLRGKSQRGKDAASGPNLPGLLPDAWDTTRA